MRIRLRQRPGEQSGVVAVVVAIFALVLFASLAFAADLGMAYANQRRIQNGVDAATLAVGRNIATHAGISDNCATVAAGFNGAATRAIATSIFAKNVGPGASVVPGTAGFNVSCETVGTNTSTIVVTVAGQQDSPTFFGGILGRSSIAVGKSARSIVGPLGTVVGLRPFAICESFADQVQGNPGTTFVVPVTQADNGCGTSPGNWALIDFDGGANPTSDSASWTANGYPLPVTVSPPLLMNGDPGFNVNAFTAEMDTMFSTKDVVLPVFDSVTGSGNNSQFNIVGFMSVTPCRYKINNKTGPGTVNTACPALPPSVPSDYIQLMYSSYVPVGQISLTCPFGTDLCDDGPRSSTLAD